MFANPGKLNGRLQIRKKAMVLAAGLGTRLRPVTKNLPKALIRIHGMPLLEIVIRRLILAGFDDVVVNVHHHSEKIRSFLGEKENFGIRIAVSEEQPLPLDTGGALRHAYPLLKDAGGIIVHNVDVLTDLTLGEFYSDAMNSQVPVVLSVRERKATRYLLADDNMHLCGWEDARSGEQRMVRKPVNRIKKYGFSGIQFLHGEILKRLPEKKIFSLIEFYLDLAKTGDVKLKPRNSGFWYDLGKPETFVRAEREIAREKFEALTGKSV